MAEGGGTGRRRATIGEALAAREQRLFVGRQSEMLAFRSWLLEATHGPRILSVTGPGGVGKTTLLRAFAEECRASQLAPMLVDGRLVEPTPTGFVRALGGSTVNEAVAAVATGRSVLLVDAFDDLRPLTHFLLEELLPALPADVPIVIASRDDVTLLWRPWRDLVQVLALGGLTAAEARELLRRRGVTDSAIDRIVSVAKGHPLALSVAADVVLRGGDRELPDVPEWHVAVRSLVEDLLRHVDDPELRSLLEAASILRQFDESTLTEMTGSGDVSGAFTRLCGLSIVRPGPRGLMLHDDIRGAIREDLRWRNPQRYQTLRRVALDYYRRLAQRTHDTEQSGWLLTEASYLSEDPFVHLSMFSGDDPTALWAEPARDADRPLLRELQAAFVADLPVRRERPAPEELDPDLLDRLVPLPDARIRLVWSREGRAEGYGLALPMTPAVLGVLPQDGLVARLVSAALGLGDGPPTPGAVPDGTWYLGTVVTTAERDDEVISVLTREIVRLFAERRLLLASTADPVYQAVLQGFGFVPVDVDPPDDAFPGLQGFALDLRLLGPDTYLQAVATAAPLPRLPPIERLEPELEAVLERWDDDHALAASPLREVASVLLATAPASGADGVRKLVTESMVAARKAAPADEQAFRAVEAGYLEGNAKFEVAARRLAVSRPTFYRMRKRAVRAMVDQLVTWAQTGDPGAGAT